MSTDPGVWIAAALTIFVWSFLFKENIFSRFAEFTFVGMMTGHLIVMGVSNIRSYASVPLSRGDLTVIVPVIFALMLYGAVSRRYYWLSRWPTALLMGTATALAVRGFLTAYIVSQSVGNINAARAVVGPDIMAALNSGIIIVFSICTFSYFLFTIGLKGAATVASRRIARLAMMVAFGAVIGNTVLAYMTMVLNRVIFLFIEWLGLA